MRRFFVLSIGIFLIQSIAVATFAQQATPAQASPVKGVEGSWKGSMQIPNGGEMEMGATFKKEKDIYTGTVTVQSESPFKSVKVDGDKVEARAEFETPNGIIVVIYNFTLTDDILKGKGEVDMGGQKMALDINLKRVAEK